MASDEDAGGDGVSLVRRALGTDGTRLALMAASGTAHTMQQSGDSRGSKFGTRRSPLPPETERIVASPRIAWLTGQ